MKEHECVTCPPVLQQKCNEQIGEKGKPLCETQPDGREEEMMSRLVGVFQHLCAFGDNMAHFQFFRKNDETGVSGTGLVMNGWQLPTGEVVGLWEPNGHGSSLNIYSSFEEFANIHIASHPNNGSQIVWDERV